MKTSSTHRVTSILWMFFVAGIVAEHGYIGYKAHNIIMENQVLKAQLTTSIEAERSLANFVKSIMPDAFQGDKGNSTKNSKAAKIPAPHPGISINGSAN